MPRSQPRRQLVVASVVFALAAAVAGNLIWRSEQDNRHQEHERIASVAKDRANALALTIERALSAAYSLATLVRQGKGDIADFDAVAGQMLRYHPGVAALELSPGGVIRKVVPLAGNEKALGFDQLHDPVQGREAMVARDTGKLMLAGPIDLVQGGLGASARLPVFLEDAKRQPYFWGFTCVVIRFPDALAGARLDTLAQHGVDFELWRIHPISGQKQVIAASAAAPLAAPVEQRLDLPYLEWTLSVAPRQGWGDPLVVWLKAALGLMFSLLLGYVAMLLMRQRSYQLGLERLVAERTRELSRANRELLADIALRQQQEEQTHQLLAEKETILGNALVGIVHLNQRRIVSCNRRFEEIFQYAPGELIGASTELLYDTHENYLSIGERVNEVLGNTQRYSEEVLLRHKDGSLFWGFMTGCAFDAAHPLDGSIWIYADISQRRQAEQESRKLLQAIEQCPVSIVITDREGTIEYVNPCFTRITGYSRAEAVGRNPRILKTEHTPPATHEELWRTILAGRIWHGVLRNRCKNGDLIWDEMSISPIFNTAGEITNFVAVKEDVTERKRTDLQLEAYRADLEDLVTRRTAQLEQALEAARQAGQAKDEFLANITHELRTPLSAVLGFSSLARPFCSDARQRDYLDKVNSAGKTLSCIIDDLLDLSKIVAGRMTFEARPFSLRQLVARARSVISFRAEEKGLELAEIVAADVPDVLVGDSLRLEQILLNLLGNAVKFTAAGRVALRIGLERREAQRACLAIAVADTGIGMRAEEIALLFKPFSQADASVTRKFGGTGLGLAICKHLVELMDGEIGVESHPGRGSTFRIRLWLGLGEAADLAPADAGEPVAAQIRYRDARVLVVDDQPFNREVVEGMLAVAGITPQLAANGQEAIDILTQGTEAFDLVLMDIQMPVMDGITATRAIRGMAGLAQLPIIAMTAHAVAHEREKREAAGFNGYIGKPFDEASFLRLLARWIPRRKQHLPAPVEPPPVPACDLPPLRCVDTRAGLALMGGDTARYRHWLGEFVAAAPAAVSQIHAALAAHDPAQASMAAHALRGRMGLLGLKELQAVAGALEAALDSAEPADELLLDLAHGINAASAEIRAKLALPERTPLPNEPLPAPLPEGEPPDCVTRLIAGLRAGDASCDRLLAECLGELGDTAWAPRLRQAQIHVRQYEHAAAVRSLCGERGGQANEQALEEG